MFQGIDQSKMEIVNPNENEMSKIMCCMCGELITPNATNMCAKCLNDQVDISEGIPRQINIFQCRTCKRWLRNQKWFPADLESAELMAICLKKVTGLNKVKLVDAVWVWTEPHSRRLKLRLTIEKEVFAKDFLQKKFIIQYIQKNQQCSDCAASFTEHTWQAVVQARQKVKHKKTFLYIEQMILKHNLAANCMGIKYQPNGLDFFFVSRSHANHFADFFRGAVPCRSKDSKRLVTHDPKSNIYKYKHTYYVEICPVCKNDLVILPPIVARQAGGFYPVVLCTKVSSTLHLMDVNTLKPLTLDSADYFKRPFPAAAVYGHTKTFYVLDVNPVRGPRGQPITRGKFTLCEVELILEDDLEVGNMENVVDCRSHLGHLLNPGDNVAAYDLRSINFHVDVGHLRKHKVADVVIVKKIYKNRRRRKWKLQTMAKHMDLGDDDREEFLRDLEEDEEMRAKVNIYKDHDLESMSEATMEDVAPEIPLTELLQNFHISEPLPVMDDEEEL